MDMDFDKVRYEVSQGFIKAIPHGDLTLYNYTQHAQFERYWTPETLACRGLVARGDEIIARPFRKFFNLGERVDDPIPADVPELSTKLDGSLLIVFYDGERWRTCTKGAWSNPQIDAAYSWLEENDHKLDESRTWLFELVAPWNRIVVAYPEEKMILIGGIDTATGQCMSHAELEVYARDYDLEAVEYITKPIEAVDVSQPFNNQEGYVARFADGFRLKIKFDDYKRIHAVLSTASTDFVVEALAAGKRERLEYMPDEFMDWLKDEERRVMALHDEIVKDARALADRAAPGETQKDKAMVVLTGAEHLRPVAFNMLAGKDWQTVVWKQVSRLIDKRLWRPASATAGGDTDSL